MIMTRFYYYLITWHIKDHGMRINLSLSSMKSYRIKEDHTTFKNRTLCNHLLVGNESLRCCKVPSEVEYPTRSPTALQKRSPTDPKSVYQFEIE